MLLSNMGQLMGSSLRIHPCSSPATIALPCKPNTRCHLEPTLATGTVQSKAAIELLGAGGHYHWVARSQAGLRKHLDLESKA